MSSGSGGEVPLILEIEYLSVKYGQIVRSLCSSSNWLVFCVTLLVGVVTLSVASLARRRRRNDGAHRQRRRRWRPFFQKQQQQQPKRSKKRRRSFQPSLSSSSCEGMMNAPEEEEHCIDSLAKRARRSREAVTEGARSRASRIARAVALKSVEATKRAFGERDINNQSLRSLDHLKKRPSLRRSLSLEDILPSDATPWDRLHVWLVNGIDLPWRPTTVWPFEPHIAVFVEGDDDTGSSRRCPIGAYEFRVKAPYMDSENPVWDERGLLCFRRGGLRRLRVVLSAMGTRFGGMYSADALHPRGLMRCLMGRGRTCCMSLAIPSEASKSWTEILVPFCGGNIVLRVRLKPWEERPTHAVPRPMTDEVIDLKGGEKAVLSHILHAEGERALMWLPGRNDAFFHWHLLDLFREAKIDLYVLSYRRVGACIRMGFVKDPHRVSHCSTGDLEEYHEEIKIGIRMINAKRSYKGLLAYSHSTGAPVLLDYLTKHGDADFCGFIFNSPFLDWGWDVSQLQRLVLRNLPGVLVGLRIWSNETQLTDAGGPNAWALQMYSQFVWDTSRPLYNVPITVGFCRGIGKAHASLRKLGRAGVPITLKPFVVLTSKGDDVLHGDEMLRAAHAIGPSRTLLELTYARHDVFCSADAEGIDAAISYLSTWLVANGLSTAVSRKNNHTRESAPSSPPAALPNDDGDGKKGVGFFFG